MAPSHFIPVTAKTYKLPENKIMPAVNRTADQFNKPEGIFNESSPTANNPNA